MKRNGLRLLAVLVALCVLAGVLALAGSAWVVTTTKSQLLTPDDTPPADADCILVLGCSVRPDGTPSPMLRDRVARGAQLYRAGWAKKLLLTGDNSSEHYNEVAVMDQLAQAQGVPAEDTVLDYAGLCTYDSMYRARDIFGVKKLIIVTQEYHLYRALYLAQALGLEAWGVAAEGQDYHGQTMRDLREILARDKDLLWSIVQPRPKYLGDPIPLATAD